MTNYRVRRATLDDVAALKELWKSMGYAADDLEKRLTEFQVVQSPDGKIVGALGIQITRTHARLHSESFGDFSLSDQVRTLLLDRVQLLASNHGVFRLWTQERTPFWRRTGFQQPTPEALKKLPEQWPAAEPSSWLTLQLKDEEVLLSVDKEFALFKASEKERTAKALEQARSLKTMFTWIIIVIMLILMGVAVYTYLQRAHGRQPASSSSSPRNP